MIRVCRVVSVRVVVIFAFLAVAVDAPARAQGFAASDVTRLTGMWTEPAHTTTLNQGTTLEIGNTTLRFTASGRILRGVLTTQFTVKRTDGSRQDVDLFVPISIDFSAREPVASVVDGRYAIDGVSQASAFDVRDLRWDGTALTLLVNYARGALRFNLKPESDQTAKGVAPFQAPDVPASASSTTPVVPLPAVDQTSLAQAAYDKARNLSFDGKINDAIAALSRVVADFPGAAATLRSNAWFQLGQLHLQNQQGAPAREAFANAINIGGLPAAGRAVAEQRFARARELEISQRNTVRTNAPPLASTAAGSRLSGAAVSSGANSSATTASAGGVASQFAGRWTCRTGPVGVDTFIIDAEGTASGAGSITDDPVSVSGSTIRWEYRDPNPTFFDRRAFQFTLNGNELRGTRTETFRQRPPQVDEYVCQRAQAASRQPGNTSSSSDDPRWKQMLDTLLATLSAMGDQSAANTLRQGIASGELRDERALDAAIGALLRGADSDPQLRGIVQQLRNMLAEQSAAAPAATGPQGGRQSVGGQPAAAANNRRLDGRWRCGENSPCNGASEIVLPRLGSGGFRFMDSRGLVAATMDFFWENITPSRSSSPSAPRSDVTLRMEVRNFSLCAVTVGGTVYANGQTAGYVGSASSSEPNLQSAPNGGSLTRSYTITGIPDGATVTVRTGDNVRDICLP